MPDFELSGPDGARYQLTAPDEAAALAAFSTLRGGKPAEEPISATNLARSAARGVPIVGGLVNKAEAATEAALAPIVEPFLDQGPNTLTTEEGFGGRYRKALRLQEAKDTGFDVAHPVASTAAKIAGGVGSLGGVMARVPGAAAALGAEGAMAQMVGRGAASGAALSAADAAVRGENPIQAAEEGAVLGAAGGPVGKAIGKVAGAAMGAFRPKAPPVHANTTNVAGVDVPVPTTDPVAAGKIEIARRGGAGEPAQRVVQQGDEATQAAIEQARGNIGAAISPNGVPAPVDAAEAIATNLRNLEQQRFQTQQNIMQRAIQGTEDLRRSLDVSRPQNVPNGTAAPVIPQSPQIYADSPLSAGEIMLRGVQSAAESADQARTAAYNAKAAIPGEYDRAALARTGQAIRTDLSSGPINERVRITSSTPKATEAMDIIDETLGGMPPRPLPNEAAPFPTDPRTGIPTTVRPTEPLTGETVEEVRKALNRIYGEARRAAAAPGGNESDLRAVGRIIDAFDTHIDNVEAAGGFSGDATALAAARDAARQAHATYKSTFSPRDAKDATGKIIEKMTGRFGQEVGPDQALTMAYGPLSEPGGTPAAQFAQRYRDIVGPQSKEWATQKQGLLSYLVDNPDGTPRAAGEAADRITKFLDAPKGKVLAHVMLNPKDRAAWRAHAEVLRASEPVPLSSLDSIEKVIARISGRDGGLPALGDEVMKYLFNPSAATKESIPVLLVHRLKQALSPDNFEKLQGGMWEFLTKAPEGHAPFTNAALAKRVEKFFLGDGKRIAQALYPKEVQAEAIRFAEAVRSHVPIAGTTNPSGTAPMLAKMAGKASHLALPLFGAAHGGIVGAIGGVALDRGITSATNARAARQIGRLYYGPQPNAVAPVDPAFAKAGVLLGRGVQQGQVGSR